MLQVEAPDVRHGTGKGLVLFGIREVEEATALPASLDAGERLRHIPLVESVVEGEHRSGL